jgi:hypothetical protein
MTLDWNWLDPITGRLGDPGGSQGSRARLHQIVRWRSNPVTSAGAFDSACYGGAVARRHQRFALLDVTFAGASMPSATVDCWEDAAGNSQWSARVVTRTGPALDEGELCGRTADGRSISGHVLVAGRQVGAGGRRETLVEFHGSGDLHGLDDAMTVRGDGTDRR